jgi:hypothetical protein
VSLIGTLEQFKLASILQRIEVYAKTGLLTIKQGVQWVELYFREGRLICIGPMRTTPTLGDRLIQDGVITPRTLQEALRSLETTQPSETRLALALMDQGYVSREDLRAWAAQKATEVLQILLLWTSGEVHFEEGAAPPPDRLLVGLSVTPLIDAAKTTTTDSPTSSILASHSAQDQPGKRTATIPTDIARITTLMGAEQFFSEPASRASSPDLSPVSSASAAPSVQPPAPEPAAATPPVQAPIRASSLVSLSPASSLPATESLSSPLSEPQETSRPAPASLASLPATESLPPLFSIADEDEPGSQPLAQPVPVMNPVPPRRIDTRFMQPDMILTLANLAALRTHNPMVQITPQQWQVLTQVDGRASLMAISQALRVPFDLLLPVVGELVASGLIQVIMPGQIPADAAVSSPGVMNSGFNHGYITPGYAAATASPWAPAPPVSDVLPPAATSQPPATRAPYQRAYAQVGGGTR